MVTWWQTYILNPQSVISIWIIHHLLSAILNVLQFIASPWGLEGYVHLKKTFWSTALKWNHGFLRKAIQKTLLKKRWRKLHFPKKITKNLRGLKGFHFLHTTPLHPLPLNCLNRVIKDNLNIFYLSRDAKTVFSPGPMVSFRSARKISS